MTRERFDWEPAPEERPVPLGPPQADRVPSGDGAAVAVDVETDAAVLQQAEDAVAAAQQAMVEKDTAPMDVLGGDDDPETASVAVDDTSGTTVIDHNADVYPFPEPDDGDKRRLVRLGLLAAGLVVASIAVVAIAFAQGDETSPLRPVVAPAPDTEETPATRVADRKDTPQGKKEKKADRRRPRNSAPGNAGAAAPPVVIGDAPEAPAGGGAPAPGSEQGSSEKSSQPKSQPEPVLAPAPTRYLYHLYNAESGDHFVTTDGNTASTYEGKGYDQGGAIGRLYTYDENRTATKAISTNYGTGYIFANASPKTEPASRTVALWYSSNGDGDFFYTTSEAEAKQKGWNGYVIGYVRTLS